MVLNLIIRLILLLLIFPFLLDSVWLELNLFTQQLRIADFQIIDLSAILRQITIKTKRLLAYFTQFNTKVI